MPPKIQIFHQSATEEEVTQLSLNQINHQILLVEDAAYRIIRLVKQLC